MSIWVFSITAQNQLGSSHLQTVSPSDLWSLFEFCWNMLLRMHCALQLGKLRHGTVKWLLKELGVTQFSWLLVLGSFQTLPAKETLNNRFTNSFQVFYINNQCEGYQNWAFVSSQTCFFGFVRSQSIVKANETVAFLEITISPNKMFLYNSKEQVLFLPKPLQPNRQNLSIAWQPICIILRFLAKLLKLIRWQTSIIPALINKKSRLLALETSVYRAVQWSVWGNSPKASQIKLNCAYTKLFIFTLNLSYKSITTYYMLYNKEQMPPAWGWDFSVYPFGSSISIDGDVGISIYG